jgi:hypothetical protein
MIDFPNSPTLGQIFSAAGANWRWDGVKWVYYSAGGSSITVSDTPPVSPTAGSMWWDCVGGQLYIWYDDPSADPGQWVAATNSPGPVGPQGVPGTRNLLHNSMFNVAQRGAGAFVTSGVYTADRWQMVLSVSSLSITVVALADADRTGIGDEAAVSSLQSVVGGTAGAGDLAFFVQSIEGVRRTAAKTVTLSFYAKANAGTPKVGLNWAQGFGTGGSPSAQVNGSAQAVTLSTSWVRYTATFAIPSAAGKTLGTAANDSLAIYFWLSSGATNNTLAGGIGVQSFTLQIWGVQLEIGSVATALEKPDPRYDLANCQRFYQTVVCGARNYFSATPSSVSAPSSWPTMRATPTTALVTAGINANTGGTYTLNAAYPNGGYFNFVGSTTGDSYALNYLFSLSADL